MTTDITYAYGQSLPDGKNGSLATGELNNSRVAPAYPRSFESTNSSEWSRSAVRINLTLVCLLSTHDDLWVNLVLGMWDLLAERI